MEVARAFYPCDDTQGGTPVRPLKFLIMRISNYEKALMWCGDVAVVDF